MVVGKIDPEAPPLGREKTRAVFFTTDRGYLVPTIVGALQVMSQPDTMAIADVLIVLVDFSDAESDDIAGTFEALPCGFLRLPKSSYALPEGAVYNNTHVPQSTLARLAAGPFIPERYEHLVYLDGDIQIAGSILPLVSHDVPPGRILAGNDHAYLNCCEIGNNGVMFRNYLKKLGISDPRDYFNAGVLAARRTTWIAIASDALAYIQQNSSSCIYHDQSALNAVSVGRREVLHPSYNFISWYKDLKAEEIFAPVVIHFTGGSKPWQPVGASWGGQFLKDYKAVVERFPLLSRYSASSRAVGPPGKTLAQRIMFWRPAFRRRRIRSYLRSTKFVF